MNPVVIHYFSATGNTARAVQVFRDRLEKAGRPTQIQLIALAPPQPVSDTVEEVLAFPTLAFSAPVMVKNYIRRLPRVHGRTMAVLCVNAGGPAQAIRQAEGLLKRRGYEVRLTASAEYPHNWAQFFSTPDKESLPQVLAKGDAEAQAFAEDYLAETLRLDRPGPLTLLWSGFAAFAFGVLGRRLLGKAFVADSTCTACGYCARSCPAGTIVQRKPTERPVWKANCQNCNRCINLCPSESIQTSNLRLGIHLALNGLLSLAAAATGVALGSLASGGLAWYLCWPLGIAASLAALALLTMLQLTLVDTGIAFFQRRFPQVFEKAFTRTFRRYRAPGFRPELTPPAP